MSHVRNAGWKHKVCKCLLFVALPTACAVGTEPEGGPDDGNGGTSAEAGTSGASGGGGSSAGSGVVPTAGTSANGGSGAVGGSASGGKAGSGSGGSGGKAGGSSGGSSAGGTAGASAGGTGGAGGGTAGAGGGGGLCACAVTKPWVDNTNISWKTGDCLTVGAATYVYTGTKDQTYANVQCNPTKQDTWCQDSGSDFKFMLCP